MKFSTYAATVLLAALPIHLAPAGAPVNNESQLVMNITQQACDAIRAADVPALEKLLAPDFTLVSSNADVQTREEVLAEVRNRDPRYEVFRNHSMSARVYANAAVVQGITSLKGVSGDKAFELDVRFTDTLIKERGQWRLVVSHVTRLPAAK
jgi:ketosteroid isomerase-like protein